jgi:nitrite reductase/ring-hydroxylating ferredoxin subunit
MQPPGIRHAVARASDVPPGTLRAVVLPDGTRICLANVGGKVVAVHDECPHQEFPLSEGTLLGDAVLECAWHGARFDCLTGAVLHPPAEQPLRRYDVAVEGDVIFVGDPLLP